MESKIITSENEPNDKAEVISYNFTRSVFGDGDDVRDWMNSGDTWRELEDYEKINLKGNLYQIWFEVA